MLFSGIFFSLSDKYQRLFTSINSSSSTGESNSTSGKEKLAIETKHFPWDLASTNEVSKAVFERNQDLERENERIQRLNTSLQSRIHEITLRVTISNRECLVDLKIS